MAEKKEKQYVSDNAQLMAEWNWERNTDIVPSHVALGSDKKVWWKCGKGHEWQATIDNRNRGRDCPYCSGRYAIIGVNDLQTVNPILANEWNYEKNNGLTPVDVLPSSNKKVWWRCNQGHEWQATIASRHSGCGCPYCAGRYAIKGENDLYTVNPALAGEWNYERNDGLTPMDVLPNSSKKVWWKCGKGHEWQASIASRNSGNGCPYCSNLYIIKGENDLNSVNPALAGEWNYERNDGLTPMEVTPNSHKKVWWKCSKGHEWPASIANRNKGIGCPICTSERKTSFPEYILVYYLKKYGFEVVHSYKEEGYELDLYIPSRKIAIEYDGYLWHKDKAQKDIEKNLKCKKAGIKLYRVREGLLPLNDSSIDFVVQKGQKDLSKTLGKLLTEIVGATVDIDIERDSIAIENLREYTEKEKSILVSNPEIAKEWNYEKNGNLKPEHFAANSNKKVWWKCDKGHEWQATIFTRNKGHRCPYCSGIKTIIGYTDLQTINPTLANEWNYEKNNGLTPMDVAPNSNKKVWWKCSKGHEWQATITSRHSGCRCPFCAGRYAVKGENDLYTVNPTLADEWNYEKNNGLTPMDVLPNSNKKVWWKCNQGHEWQAKIQGRTKGSGCPQCAREKRKSAK